MRICRLPALWVSLLLAGGACAPAPAGDAAFVKAAADAEPLHEAMRQLSSVMVYDIFSPPQASRAYSYASIAAYETLRHDHAEFRSFAGQLNDLDPVPVPEAGQDYYLPLAGVHAFLSVSRALTFSQPRIDSVRTAMHEHFRSLGVPDAIFERSVAYGDQVAQHILDWSKQDRFTELRGAPKYTVTSSPGSWVPTPPAYMDAVEPHWQELRPFALDSSSQFRPNPPHPFDLSDGSPFRREVLEVYETGRRLTEEQRAIAAFWECNPYVMNVRGHAMIATKKITPGGHWVGIAAIAARQSNADLMHAAEAYALTAIVLADGFISNWDEKFRSNLVRPETVINAHLDESWEPLVQTPPFPEYTSGHSVISAAAATVLTDLYGEAFAFQDTVEEEYGLPARSFTSFSAAADEAAISRLYGGIHYRMAIEEGLVQGRNLAGFVLLKIRTRSDDASPTYSLADAP